MSAPGRGSGVREGLKRLGGESLVYGLGQAGSRAVSLLLVPILTRALAPAAYGVADSVIAYAQFALLVLVMGMDAALARFFYQESDTEARRTMVSSSLALRIGVSAAVALAVLVASGPLAEGLLGSRSYVKYVQIAGLTLPATLLVLFTNDVLRVTFQPWKFIAFNLLNVVLVAGFSIAFVVGMRAGVVGVLYGKLLGDALALPAGAWLVRHTVRFRVRGQVLRRMVRYGAPLVPAALAYGVMTSADRWFLVRTRTLEEVGIYAVAAKFFAAVMLIVSAFQLAFGPFAFARAGEPEAPRLYARVLGLYVGCASLGALALGLCAPLLVRVLAPPAYAAAAWPALFLGFAAAAYGAYYVAALGATLALRTEAVAWTSLLAAGAALAAHAVLTPRYGPTGAALATLVGHATSTVALFAVSQRLHPLPYRGVRALLLFAAALAAALLGALGAARWPEWGWGARVAAFALGAGASVVLGVWWTRGAVRGTPGSQAPA